MLTSKKSPGYLAYFISIGLVALAGIVAGFGLGINVTGAMAELDSGRLERCVEGWEDSQKLSFKCFDTLSRCISTLDEIPACVIDH